jgi:hypothetical protein
VVGVEDPERTEVVEAHGDRLVEDLVPGHERWRFFAPAPEAFDR